MNERDVRLNRLFDTARLSMPSGEPGAMPLHLKRRVIASWRADHADSPGRGVAVVFRTALACPAVLMLASIAWSFAELTHEPTDDVAIANYQLRVDVMQWMD
jgi:hypothetical protein